MLNSSTYLKVFSVSLVFAANASAQTFTKSVDSFSDCHSIVSQIDQDGLLRAFTEGQDGDTPTFGYFQFTDKGEVDLNMHVKNLANAQIDQKDGKLFVSVSRSQHLGLVKTDNVEHYFTFDSNKLASMYVTAKYQKGGDAIRDGNRWGLNFSFKVDPANNTCVLSRITSGTEGAPKSYQPKVGSTTSGVEFDFAGCKNLMELRATFPNSQYCGRIGDDHSMMSSDLHTDEVMRLEDANVLTPDSMATNSFVKFCKSFQSNADAQKALKLDLAQAGDLCKSIGSSSVRDYVQSYSTAHPGVAIGGAVAAPAVGPAANVNQAQ
jgi:hypothetical protein